jgi:histidine ammonia-lyase
MQSAYSLRCAPTVIGAARDMLAFAIRQVEVELNSVTDNPLILLDAGPMPEGFRHDEQNRAWSAGLFHGEPVGMAMDALKIAVAEVANLSERRLYRLTTPHLSEQLPSELAGTSLLGMMSPQTTAAALVSENKALGWPASMDSIPTCEDQEDHVAMSTTAARRAARVVDNCRRVIAIEVLAAAQALELRAQRGLEPGVGGRALSEALRQGGMLTPELLPSEAIAAVERLLRGPLPAGLPALVGVGAPLPREARP